MKKNILNKLLAGLFFLLILTACGSKKKLVKSEPSLPAASTHVEMIKNVELSNLNFHSFSAKAKAKVEMGKESQNVNLNIRMDRGKTIWISVTALLGIEAARVIITPDSVKIMNKIQGEYVAKPFSYIYNYVNPGISFNMLQDILMGNITVDMLRTDQLQVATSTEDFQLIGIKDGLTFHYGVKSNNRPFSFNLMELGKNRKLETYYGDYASTDGYNFPQRFTLTIEGDDVKLAADLVYNKVEFNKALELPFNVPSRYKVIN